MCGGAHVVEVNTVSPQWRRYLAVQATRKVSLSLRSAGLPPLVLRQPPLLLLAVGLGFWLGEWAHPRRKINLTPGFIPRRYTRDFVILAGRRLKGSVTRH